MKYLFHTILLSVFVTSSTVACKCRDYKSIKHAQRKSFEYADLVFHGRLIVSKPAENTYAFVINTLYKGVAQQDTLYGKRHDSCSKFPEVKGNWIVYADIKPDGRIDISSCLISRSEKDPMCLVCYDPPRPSKKRESKAEYASYLAAYETDLAQKSKKHFYQELELLRENAKH